MASWTGPQPFLNFASGNFRGNVPAGCRLMTFVHAGGSASAYAQWPKQLSSAIQVTGVEMPGHGMRVLEQPLVGVPEMAQEVASAIQALPGSEIPLAFYGHSLGALVAFETARLLGAEAGSAPVHLFVGSAQAPQLPRAAVNITHLEEDEFLLAVQHRYGGIPAAVLEEPELLEMIMPAMRADFTAFETYRYAPGPALPCPITVFLGKHDPLIRESAGAGWSDHTSGSFRLHVVPGDHFFLAESGQQVLQVISSALIGSGVAQTEVESR